MTRAVLVGVTKLTKSLSKKKSALKDDDQEAAPEPRTAQKLKTLNEVGLSYDV